MQARFLLGPAGSGKTFRCLAEIRAELRRDPGGPPLLLLAPKQATFQLERQLLADIPGEPPLPGYTRLQILSFDRLAQFVLAQLRVAAPQVLGEEGRVMVLRALLMRHEPELRLFARSARRPGFAQELARLLAELRQYRFPTARLRQFAAHPELPEELRLKFHDLAVLAAAQHDWLAQKNLQDADSLLEAAAAALRAPAAAGQFPIAALWLDGFAEMTPAETDLLATVVRHCDRATLAFCLDAEPQPETSWLSIWSGIGKTYQRCRAAIAAGPGGEVVVEVLPRRAEATRFTAPALAHLEANWPQSTRNSKPETQNSAIRLVACAHPDAEAVFAAREILRFVRGGGRFREAAVLVRSLTGYHKPLERAFRRHGVPYFLDRRESMAHHPLAELTRSALRLAAFDWRQEDWFAALKAGFSGVLDERIDELENTALARGWRGKKWLAPLPTPDKPEIGEWFEPLRQKIVPPFAAFTQAIAAPRNGVQLAAALRELWAELAVEKTLEQWGVPDAIESPIANRRSPIHQTVWQQMKVWLDNLELAFSAETLSVRDWLPILDAGLANLTVGVIPPALDQVLIGAIDRSRNPDLKLALVLGLNEGVFPAAPAAPGILTDADREALLPLGEPLGLGLRDRLARERFYGYIAFTRASREVIATYAAAGADGKALNPSPLVAQLRRLFPGLPQAEFSGAVEWPEAAHAGDLTGPLLRLPVTGQPPAGWSELLALPALATLADALRGLKTPDPAERLSPARAAQLYGDTMNTSVSKLEHFAACPFRFFLYAGLRADERRRFEIDAREQGSFQHDVLAAFHNQLAAEGRTWRDVTPAEARQRVGKIAAEQVDKFHNGLFADDAGARFAAEMLTGALQDFIAVNVGWMRETYQFTPHTVELVFGGRDATVPAWTLALGDGHQFALQGRIDRIDLCTTDGGEKLAVVVDYKSSAKELDAVLVENGVQLQLITYLNALRSLTDAAGVFGAARLTPAGVFYVGLRGRYENHGTRATALVEPGAALRQAYAHTGRFDAKWLEKFGPRRKDGESDQFNYRVNADGSLRKGSAEALAHEAFIALLDGVEGKLREFGREIYAGTAAVDPYRKAAATACDYCDCRAVCRIDPWTHQFRVLKKSDGGGP